MTSLERLARRAAGALYRTEALLAGVGAVLLDPERTHAGTECESAEALLRQALGEIAIAVRNIAELRRELEFDE